MSTEKILSKVTKLLNLSKDSGASDSEAMSALALAQSLMAKYGIEASDLDEIERDESNVIQVECEHRWDMGYRKPLAAVISENYRCKVFCKGGTVVFMGVEEDAKIAKQAFEFAYKFIYRRGNQEYEKARACSWNGSAKGVFNGYAAGFIKGLDEVLSAQSKALMITVPDTVITEFNNLTLGKGRGGIQTGNGLDSDAYNRGRNDAHEQYGKLAICGN